MLTLPLNTVASTGAKPSMEEALRGHLSSALHEMLEEELAAFLARMNPRRTTGGQQAVEPQTKGGCVGHGRGPSRL